MNSENIDIIQFFESVKNTTNMGGLKHINLNQTFKNLNPFQRFIFANRVVPFLFLKILFHFYNETDYYVGFKEHQHRVYDPEAETEDDYMKHINSGPTLIKKKLSGNEVFDFVLSDLHFSSILLKNIISPFSEEIIDKKEKPAEADDHEEFYNQFVILNNKKIQLVLVEQDIFCNENIYNTILGLLDHHKKFIKPVLNNLRKLPSVPHDQYCDWLVNWFPGKVHVKMFQKDFSR